MAIKRFVIDGYGQIELNNCAFRRDGRIEAQCALDATDFATLPAENGMLLAVDNVTRTVRFPDTTEDCPIAINYTTEHMYDERIPGLKNFKLDRGTFLPRLGYLATGDKFTTNCFSYDADDFADDDAIKAIKLSGEGAVVVYASEYNNGDGTIVLKKTTATSGKKVNLKVIEVTTMPDGTFGLKFQVI